MRKNNNDGRVGMLTLLVVVLVTVIVAITVRPWG